MLGAQEYLVTDIIKVRSFIDREIGIDYEVTRDSDFNYEGSIAVFEIEYDEHLALRKFITDNKLWLE